MIRLTSPSKKDPSGLATFARLSGFLFLAGLLTGGSFLDELWGDWQIQFARSPADKTVRYYYRTAKLLRESYPTRSLQLLEKAVAWIDSGGPVIACLVTRVYTLQGDLYQGLWEYVDAQTSWNRALPHATNHERQLLQARLSEVGRTIERNDTERRLQTVYTASPNVGPAATLKGRVAVAYVFVRDESGAEWSVLDREVALRSWALAENWLAAHARLYGADVTFTRRVFLFDHQPAISHLRVRLTQAGYEAGNNIARIVAQELRAPDVLTFLNRFKSEARATQVVLILHIARNDRSFTQRCEMACDQDGEYVFLLESPRPRRWESMEYAQAHETLHLFGADDLYNIATAGVYATRDVMHYPSRILSASTLEPITAFATGLEPNPPAAPFRILRH